MTTNYRDDWREINWTSFISLALVAPAVVVGVVNRLVLHAPLSHVGLWLGLYPAIFLTIAVPLFALWMVVRSYQMLPQHGATDVEKYFSFPDKRVQSWFGKNVDRTVPFCNIHDAYMQSKLDIKQDMLETLRARHKYANFRLTWEHVKYFCTVLIPELLVHSRVQDRIQVTEHYDRGNSFYAAFLGETMIYTSAFFKTPEDSLEVAQTQKLDLVCRKLHLKKGMRHLDFGCGWGTLVAHAAKYYGTESVGVSIAKEQEIFANNVRFPEYGVCEKSKGDVGSAKFVCADYRDAPRDQKFNAISCLEMAEHVGVRKFQAFLQQVYDMLEDDGFFYLQIAGLRRSWQFEDLNWGMFMGKYVFPGADASTPVGWVINQLEEAGFEVHSLENVGIHYSLTINRWYDNWQTNKKAIIEEYGERWWRQWNVFLAWSVLAPEQGRATCHMITLQKNTSRFNRSVYIGEQKTFKY